VGERDGGCLILGTAVAPAPRDGLGGLDRAQGAGELVWGDNDTHVPRLPARVRADQGEAAEVAAARQRISPIRNSTVCLGAHSPGAPSTGNQRPLSFSIGRSPPIEAASCSSSALSRRCPPSGANG